VSFWDYDDSYRFKFAQFILPLSHVYVFSGYWVAMHNTILLYLYLFFNALDSKDPEG
jgi:hypothetical protein